MRRRWEARLYAAAPAAYLVLFLLVPVLAVVLHTFGLGDRGLAGLLELLRHPVDAALQLGAAYDHIFGRAFYRDRVVFTLWQATFSTALTLAAGIPLAYLFSHHNFRGRRALRAAFTVPFVLPAIVVALALHAYVGPSSLLGVDLLTPLGPLGAILLAHAFYNTSLVLRIVGNYWERVPGAYAETARTLGLGPWRTFWRVELPLARPAIVASALLVFVFCLTSFGIILLLGTDAGGHRLGTIETLIYQEYAGGPFARLGVATALALLQLVITYAALTAFVLLQRRARVPLVPRTAPDRRPLPLWGVPVVALAALFLLGPPLTLAAASFRYGGRWSTAAYERLWHGSTLPGTPDVADAVTNSLTFAGGTVLLALALAFLAALAAQRARHSAWVEGLLLLPLGLSSIVVGLGLLLSWDGRDLPDLRHSPLRIVFAHTLIAFPFATRILSPSLEAIDPGLREAARTLGAGPFAVVRLVDFPLVYPALGVAAVYAFGASLGEFGAALLLRAPDTATIPIAIYESFGRIGAPYRAQANALSVLLLVVAALGFLLLERLRRRPWGEFA